MLKLFIVLTDRNESLILNVWEPLIKEVDARVGDVIFFEGGCISHSGMEFGVGISNIGKVTPTWRKNEDLIVKLFERHIQAHPSAPPTDPFQEILRTQNTSPSPAKDSSQGSSQGSSDGGVAPGTALFPLYRSS